LKDGLAFSILRSSKLFRAKAEVDAMTREHWNNILLALFLLIAVGVLAVKGLGLLESFWYTPFSTEARKSISPMEQLPPLDRGKLVFQSAGCTSCHLARLEPGGPQVGFPVGPSLSNAGVRRDETWLRDHYINPQKLVPGSTMNSFADLPAEELDLLVAYMKTFNAQREPSAEEPNIVIPERFTPAQVEQGKALFQAHGCVGCHTIGKTGGPIGPNLTRAGTHGRTDDWQLQHLKDPVSVYVIGPTNGIAWPMPRFEHLSDEDLKALVAYVQSLQ
jgi:cbb3-type cytochrome oxidase cytochrome c subunit